MRARRFFLLIYCLLLGFAGNVFPWGGLTHKAITRNAAHSVAPDIRPFFVQHETALCIRSVEPDTRRDDHPEEYPRHFIDIDYYGNYPFPELPENYKAAVEKYGEETVLEYGVLPWRIAGCTDSLFAAMHARNTEEIIRWAAWLGHYVADAHQPLHTVLNYDGQLTGNDGIHSRYESGMLRIYIDEYTFEQRDVGTVKDPLELAFEIVRESYLISPQVITADNYATQPMEKSEVFALQEHYDNGRHSAYFARLYSQTGDMTWQRLDLAASRLAALWNYAWQRAGKPVLAPTD